MKRNGVEVAAATTKGTTIVAPEVRAGLLRVAEARGMRVACEQLGVAAATLAKAIAGLPVARTVDSHLSVRLASLGGNP